jgi:hypothetical protein
MSNPANAGATGQQAQPFWPTYVANYLIFDKSQAFFYKFWLVFKNFNDKYYLA